MILYMMKPWIKLLTCIGVFVFLFYFLILKNSSTTEVQSVPEERTTKQRMESSKRNKIDWDTVDVFTLPLPNVDSRSVKVNSNMVNAKVSSNGFIEVRYREAEIPPGVPKSNRHVLFLHGRSFSSGTWEELGSLQFLAALGHHAVAIDLPGYGDSSADSVINKNIFLNSVMDKLDIESPIVVSPSMSGMYTVGYVTKEWQNLSGFLPIAPVDTGSVPAEVWEKVELPTILLYGDKDRSGLAEDSLKNLRVLPNCRVVVFEGAGHPCYLNEPQLFHQLLHNFIHLTEK